MFKALSIALSMYTKIPMPEFPWDEKSMRYSMCFFPMAGVITALCSFACFYGLEALHMGQIASAVILCILPILINGGIHMDGFLDTIDAKSSYKPASEKLKILQDPHTGAFAIIYGMLYMFLVFALFSEVTEKEIGVIAAGYVYSRILSALSVVSLRKAKKEGMAALSAQTAGGGVKWILGAELAGCIVLMLFINPIVGITALLAGALTFVYYRDMAYRCFGGITGDLAGYFLQICELVILTAAVCMGKLM